MALFINFYPNYYAFLKTPAGYDFSGQASWFDPWDINVYVAAIRWGQQGHILLENLYSSELNNGITLYPIYTLTGWLFRQTQPFLLFHISAIFCGLIFSLTAWLLFKEFLKSTFDNIFALFIFLFGGGFGWQFFNVISSADISVTGFTSISQLQRPHEAIGVTLYFISLVFFYKALTKKWYLFNLISLLSLLLLIFFYPYYFLSYFLICGLYSLLKFMKTGDKFYLKYILVNFIVAIPLMYLYYLHLQTNPIFGSVFGQHLDTPDMLRVLLGYGVLIPFLLVQLKSKQKNEGKLFLNLWFFLSIFLSYLPLGFARYYQRGLYFPLVILAFYGINHFKYSFPIVKKVSIVIIILFVPISTVFMFHLRLEEINKNNPWYYQPKEVGMTLDNIPKQLPYSGVVLSSFNMGNYIPAHSNLRVYFGHFIQTNNSEDKLNNLYNFYANNYSEKEALEFLQQSNIKYVWYGIEEKQITKAVSHQDKLKYTFLSEITKIGDNKVFTLP